MWREYAQCKKCDEIVCHKDFSSPFFYPVCPYCGNPNDMRIVSAKNVWRPKWYNPLTWIERKWEVKQGEE